MQIQPLGAYSYQDEAAKLHKEKNLIQYRNKAERVIKSYSRVRTITMVFVVGVESDNYDIMSL